MIEYRYGILSQLISEIDNYYQKTFAQFLFLFYGFWSNTEKSRPADDRASRDFRFVFPDSPIRIYGFTINFCPLRMYTPFVGFFTSRPLRS